MHLSQKRVESEKENETLWLRSFEFLAIGQTATKAFVFQNKLKRETLLKNVRRH
jgi:hypothetical protein